MKLVGDRMKGASAGDPAASPSLSRAEADGLRYLRRLVRGDGVADPLVELKRWRASFLALLPHPSLHQGEISLKVGGRLILFDECDIPIDARLMREGEAVGTGDEIMFPCFRAVIGASSPNSLAGERVTT